MHGNPLKQTCLKDVIFSNRIIRNRTHSNIEYTWSYIVMEDSFEWKKYKCNPWFKRSSTDYYRICIICKEQIIKVLYDELELKKQMEDWLGKAQYCRYWLREYYFWLEATHNILNLRLLINFFKFSIIKKVVSQFAEKRNVVALTNMKVTIH